MHIQIANNYNRCKLNKSHNQWIKMYTFFKCWIYLKISSTCNAGDPSSIPGLGRSPGEGTGYPLQYSWASLVAQVVKNLPSLPETWVQFLGLGRFPGEGEVYPFQYSGLENSMDCIVHGVTKSWTQLSYFQKTGEKYIKSLLSLSFNTQKIFVCLFS